MLAQPFLDLDQATGRIGKHFAEELLKTGHHTVTALIRPDTKTDNLPNGIGTASVDYDDPESGSLISALQGQDFLIITLSVMAPPDLHSKIVQAAVKAGVPYIMPNIYGHDITNKALAAEESYVARAVQQREEIEKLGASYIVLVCGFWYEWSLALGEPWFGFDIKNRTVTFFDEGTTKVNISTWQQCGRAVAALLSLPVSGGPEEPKVEDWKDKMLCISSFRISQRDMLDSLNRVLGTTDGEWTITKQPTAERRREGLEEFQRGQMTGFAKAMYARIFYPSGDGDYESSRDLANGVLGLPREELDEATKRAVEMVESGWNPFG